MLQFLFKNDGAKVDWLSGKGITQLWDWLI